MGDLHGKPSPWVGLLNLIGGTSAIKMLYDAPRLRKSVCIIPILWSLKWRHGIDGRPWAKLKDFWAFLFNDASQISIDIREVAFPCWQIYIVKKSQHGLWICNYSTRLLCFLGSLSAVCTFIRKGYRNDRDDLIIVVPTGILTQCPSWYSKHMQYGPILKWWPFAEDC